MERSVSCFTSYLYDIVLAEEEEKKKKKKKMLEVHRPHLLEHQEAKEKSKTGGRTLSLPRVWREKKKGRDRNESRLAHFTGGK